MFALYFRIFFILHFSSSYLEGNIFLLPSHICFLALWLSVFCLSVSLFVCYSVSTCMYLCECLSICRSVFLSLFYGQFGFVSPLIQTFPKIDEKLLNLASKTIPKKHISKRFSKNAKKQQNCVFIPVSMSHFFIRVDLYLI